MQSSVNTRSFQWRHHILRFQSTKNINYYQFFKENVRYPVWSCRNRISLILGTRIRSRKHLKKPCHYEVRESQVEPTDLQQSFDEDRRDRDRKVAFSVLVDNKKSYFCKRIPISQKNSTLIVRSYSRSAKQSKAYEFITWYTLFHNT